MYSREHAIVSFFVGVAGTWVLSLPEVVPWWAALGWALAVGVGIDFDHFLLARVTTGDWRALRRVVRDPLVVFTDPGRIFDDGDLWHIQRLLSHVLIGGVLVAVLWVWSEQLAIFTALVIYSHVLSDLLWDNYRIDDYLQRHAEYVNRAERVETDGDG